VVDAESVKAVLRGQHIELPSWAFGNSGTRFKVFAQPGVPRDPFEKVADAAQVHRYTGVAPAVALHIPWDKVDDYARLAAAAKEQGIKIGTINANVFQDDDYKLGSITNPDPRVRRKALDHLIECVDVMDVTGERHRGLLTGHDLATWHARLEAPASYDYQGLTVCKTGPWGQGPVFLQQLALLSGYDLAAMEPGSAEYIHLITEAGKLAFADREAWYGDPDHFDVPLEHLLSDDYNDERRKLIGETASMELRPGHPAGREPGLPGFATHSFGMTTLGLV